MNRTNTAIWLEKYARWQIKVQKNNIRKTFTSATPGRNGQRECNKRADEWLDDGIPENKSKVSALSMRYIDELKLTTSRSNYEQYEGYFKNWINPKIGKISIENLSEQHFQSVINEAYSKGKAKKTLQNMRACMMSFLKFCRKSKATTLFVEDLKIPHGAKSEEKAILQPSDLKILFDKDTVLSRGGSIKEIYINAYRFEVATGLRPGEIAGLKKADISGKIISISRSINVHNEITTGKNDNARRQFYLNDFTLAILSEQFVMLKEIGVSSAYVFCDRSGESIKQTNYYKHWVAYRDGAGLSKVSPYELRHTFVSMAKSIPEGYLKQLVGHSKSMDTYGTYSHEVDGDLKAASDLINQILCKFIK